MLLCFFFILRMPVETLSVRHSLSNVGRFPSVTLGWGQDEPEKEKPEEENTEEGVCRQWLRKICSCCCQRLSDDDDITDTVVTGMPVVDNNAGMNGDKPVTGGSELEGNLLFYYYYARRWGICDKVVDIKMAFLPYIPVSELLLTVRSIDLMKTKTGLNRLEHHTDRYYGDDLIIRRGNTFMMWLDLSRPYCPNTDRLHLELKTGQ